MEIKKTNVMLALMLVFSFGLVSAWKPSDMTIVEVVMIDDGEFDVLQEAVIAADLVDALSGDSQLTVFAPTDDAFISTLGASDEAEAISIVKSLPKEDLTEILLYHVVDGRKDAEMVVSSYGQTTLSGEVLTRDELLPKIIVTDYHARNGMMHFLDEVMIPNA
jgi:uncharacterized surface protein with fasciclin (FAS1) repeats